ncbi:MAG: conserved rane protein of unknown function [Blastococcus sp.]|nr:conserved rane protein of unknown function [Blastococcus sp.]
MPTRGSLVRSLVVLGAVVGGVLALAGGLALRGPGLIAVVVAGVFAGCLCGAIAREGAHADLRAALGAAAQGAAWTVAVLLALAGTAGLAGGVIAALLGGTAVMAGAAYWLLHGARSAQASATPPALGQLHPPGGAGASVSHLLAPVRSLSTRHLGQEWLRTSAALAGRLDPAARAVLVGRRQEALDELELRDPVGFARWMLAGPVPGSDPADYVRRDRTAGTDAA